MAWVRVQEDPDPSNKRDQKNVHLKLWREAKMDLRDLGSSVEKRQMKP